MGKDIALGFGLTIGVGLTIIGLAFRFGPVDNSDAGALASFVSMPFLVIGVPLLCLSVWGLVR